jgi:hypothetical protein
MSKAFVIAFTLTFAIFSIAKAEASCARRSDNAVCWVPLPEGDAPTIDTVKVADVLCCCKTHSGGECCTRVASCGGQPTGCFCAEPSVPGARYLSSVARSHFRVMMTFCSMSWWSDRSTRTHFTRDFLRLPQPDIFDVTDHTVQGGIFPLGVRVTLD